MKKVITCVRFKEHLHLGTGLDLKGSLAAGDSILGIPVSMDFYDSTFMLLSFNGKGKDKYEQLVPWASVASVLFKEVK